MRKRTARIISIILSVVIAISNTGLFALPEYMLTASAQTTMTDDEEYIPDIDIFGDFATAADSQLATPSNARRATPSNAERQDHIFFAETDTFTVTVTAPYEAFPEGTVMEVEDVTADDLTETIEVDELSYVREVKAVDITFLHDGEEIEPELAVSVELTPVEDAPEHKQALVVHATQDETTVLDNTCEEGTYFFNTESFSTYAIAYVDEYESGDIACEGDDYAVRVSYEAPAKIPKDAALDVAEIMPDDENYDEYINQLTDLIGRDDLAIRLFDISIMDKAKVEPKDMVTVAVEYGELSGDSVYGALHFTEDGIRIMEASTEDNQIIFETDGFSVYAIVEAPGIHTGIVTSVNELDGEDAYICISRSVTTWFTWDIENVNSGGSTKWVKFSYNDEGKKMMHFTNISDNDFYISYVDGEEVEHFLVMDNKDNLYYSTEDKTAFTIEPVQGTTNTFYAYHTFGSTKHYINQKIKNNAKGFGGSTYSDAGSYLTFSFMEVDDPYELDGKSFGIIYHDEDIYGASMTSTVSSSRLVAENIMIRPDILTNDGIMLISSETDVTEWEFEWITGQSYYIKTEVGGETKYLTMTTSGISLESTPHETNSVITVSSGSGAYEGKFVFTAGRARLQLRNETRKDNFNTTTAETKGSYLSLVEKSDVLTDEDFVQYSARKVSISSLEDVYNGQKVILYTRAWNAETQKYEYYAVDHDGSVFRCYESGDSIRWVGSKINTAVWDFTEYYYEGTTNPNYYYELQNDYSEKFIAPRLGSGSVVAGSKIGININGRRYGNDYSKIIAWDDTYYAYAGIKMNGKKVVACPMSQAQDFYFAVMEEIEGEGVLTTVETVDNTQYGITMKMIDFNNGTSGIMDTKQSEYFGGVQLAANLMQTHLGPDGYPVSNPDVTGTPATSLAYLYNETDGLTEVNHLFLQSAYNESGYFEFDSTKNFAYLEDGENFTVYDQLGTISGASSTLSREHGQFLPYNSLINPATGEPWPYSTLHFNTTNTMNQELPESDPRKGEQMHEIPIRQVDYYFGMEMEASFVQTVSGLDAWGNDIIFEFSGDDDMFLYLDGELVLDLGGIHSAYTGSINFKTGIVTSTRGNSTLYDIFQANYEELHPDASQAEVEEYLDGIFELNENGQHVFIDYTSHTMKMFYMERGAGASNLKLRFNLTAVEDGEILLEKKLTGTEKQDYANMEFGFQIWYKDGNTYQLVDGTNCQVVYPSTSTPVEYRRRWNGYDHVFLITPGEQAQIMLPDDNTIYYIKECYVQSNIYDVVKANNVVLEGTGTAHKDYETEPATAGQRKKVIFDNHVDENALRTLRITKRLFDADGTRLTAEDDPTGFKFRVYMGEDLDYYRFDKYCVIDPNGYYCTYDSGLSAFRPSSYNDYGNIPATEIDSFEFHSSMSGAIDKIPAGYNVEIRDLVVGTKFMVEERSSDIPYGYKLKEYKRANGSYIPSGDTVNSGIIRDNSNPWIEIHNVRGWGLTVEKEWNDADFMDFHDDIYIGIYENGSLVADTLRVMKTSDMPQPETSLYYFFDELAPGTDFEDYDAMEVIVENPVVDADGYVTAYDSVTPVTTQITIGGQEKNDTYKTGYRYYVSYAQGQATGANDNVRTDTITNSRDGIQIIKTDWTGTPISGGTFTLLDEQGETPGAASYTADENGVITNAYLAQGTYTLEETAAPAGYTSTAGPVEITVDEYGDVSVSDNADLLISGGKQIVRVRNKPFEFTIIKKDAVTDEPMEGVHFAIYRDRNGIKDYFPMTGFEDLVTNADGELPGTVKTLYGTYYLVETQAPVGYIPINGYVKFTVDQMGVVSVDEDHTGWLTTTETDSITYTLKIPNYSTVDITIRKQVEGNMGSRAKEFPFEIYGFENDGSPVTGTYPYTKYSEGTAVETGNVVIILDDEVPKASFVTNGDTSDIFMLAHDDELTIEGLPKDVAFTVREIDPGLYSTSMKAENISSGAVYYDGQNRGVDGVVCTESGSTLSVNKVRAGGMQVTFTNALNVVMPTGLSFPTGWLLILLAISLAAILAAFGCKGQNRDEEGAISKLSRK